MAAPHLSLSLHLLASRSSVTAPAARRPPALTCRSAQGAFTLTVLITYRNAIRRHRLAADLGGATWPVCRPPLGKVPAGAANEQSGRRPDRAWSGARYACEWGAMVL